MKNKNVKERDKKKLKSLRYAVIHSQVGFADGVSIVMDQIEEVMTKNLHIKKEQIFYLVGKSNHKQKNISEEETFWHKSEINKLVNRHFHKGFGGAISEKIEQEITKAKEAFATFIAENKIDIIIAHNTSHPVNFIYSVAIARYYRDQKKLKKKTPKYILWWHDSHLERERYANPSKDVKNYLLQGVPGKHVDYTIYINGLQFRTARDYYLELDKREKGHYKKMVKNKTIIYNTASTPIKKLSELKQKGYKTRTETMLKELKINAIIKKKKLKLKDMQFCLQHTRIVERKRIDFALKYTYELFSKMKNKKAFIFIVSGHSGDEKGNYKQQLIHLNKKLAKEYNTKNFYLLFKEDYKTNITFEEMPLLIANLNGITTYFSEIEGYGNNLLEVLAAGLIPIVYTYPVFRKDIKKNGFNLIALKTFEVDPESIEQTIKVIKNTKQRKIDAEKNIHILKEKLSHKTIAPKLARAILKKV